MDTRNVLNYLARQSKLVKSTVDGVKHHLEKIQAMASVVHGDRSEDQRTLRALIADYQAIHYQGMTVLTSAVEANNVPAFNAIMDFCDQLSFEEQFQNLMSAIIFFSEPTLFDARLREKMATLYRHIPTFKTLYVNTISFHPEAWSLFAKIIAEGVALREIYFTNKDRFNVQINGFDIFGLSYLHPRHHHDFVELMLPRTSITQCQIHFGKVPRQYSDNIYHDFLEVVLKRNREIQAARTIIQQDSIFNKYVGIINSDIAQFNISLQLWINDQPPEETHPNLFQPLVLQRSVPKLKELCAFYLASQALDVRGRILGADPLPGEVTEAIVDAAIPVEPTITDPDVLAAIEFERSLMRGP